MFLYTFPIFIIKTLFSMRFYLILRIVRLNFHFLLFLLFFLTFFDFPNQLLFFNTDDVMVIDGDMMFIVYFLVEKQVSLLVKGYIFANLANSRIIHLVPLFVDLDKRVVMAAVCATTRVYSYSVELEPAMRLMLTVWIHELAYIKDFWIANHFP